MNGLQVVLLKQECHIHLMECNIKQNKISLSSTKPNYFSWLFLFIYDVSGCICHVYRCVQRPEKDIQPLKAGATGLWDA